MAEMKTKTNTIMTLIFCSVLVATIFLSGCTQITGKIGQLTCSDNCQNNRNNCYDKCGAGIIGGLCKDGCTLDYNDCLRHC